MTQPKAETIEREKDRLFVTDAQLIRRLGAPEKTARAAIRMLDKNPRTGFPKKQPLWGDLRYWPAVRRWFDEQNGLVSAETGVRNHPERLDPPQVKKWRERMAEDMKDANLTSRQRELRDMYGIEPEVRPKK